MYRAACSDNEITIVLLFFLLQVGSNGLLSFRSRINPFTPSLFPTTNFVRNGFVVAPFWSDVDARIAGCIQYQVFDPVSDNATISEVSSYISQATNKSFSGVWMLVAEWRDVHPYPHGSRNPFQLDTNQEAIVNSVSKTKFYSGMVFRCRDIMGNVVLRTHMNAQMLRL